MSLNFNLKPELFVFTYFFTQTVSVQPCQLFKIVESSKLENLSRFHILYLSLYYYKYNLDTGIEKDGTNTHGGHV